MVNRHMHGPGAVRGQGATEYLVILAAVLVIALIVIYVLSSASATSASATQSASQSYWSALTPLAVTDASQGPYSATSGFAVAKISVQNTGSRELNLYRLVLSLSSGGSTYSYVNNTATVFLPGQQRVMNVYLSDTHPTDCASYTGKSPNAYSVYLGYDDDPITGKIFNSTTKTLAVKCSS